MTPLSGEVGSLPEHMDFRFWEDHLSGKQTVLASLASPLRKRAGRTLGDQQLTNLADFPTDKPERGQGDTDFFQGTTHAQVSRICSDADWSSLS